MPEPEAAPVSESSGDVEPFSRDVPLERAAKSSTRRARSSRAPVRVDDVGDLAVAIAAKGARVVRQSNAPRLLKTRRELTDAPIDHRDAFVISLVDGTTSIPALVDSSGMSPEEIAAILARLERLGIVALA